MSAPASHPYPYLLALLLVCQTRSGSGPQLVYHWPPYPLTRSASAEQSQPSQDVENSSEDSEDWTSDDAVDAYNDKLGGDVSELQKDSSNRLDRSRSGQQGDNAYDRRNSVLGYDEDGLVALLAPERTWNKRKFELSINNLTFVGRPAFAKQNGSWRKPSKSKTNSQPLAVSETEQTTEDDEEHVSATASNNQKERVAGAADTRSELTMFHLVFVMNPPPLEHSRRVKEMYDNVIKKFSKALKWVQARHNYVWIQSERLQSKKQQLLSQSDTKVSDVTSAVLESSHLAKAMMTVFNSISNSRIASVSLAPGVSISLQIPPVTSTAYLPSLTEGPIPPGLWLTTATEAPSNSAAPDKYTSSSTSQLAKSYTLLLKSPPQKIARDAQAAGDPMASHLPKFVAALRPTKSFYKLANEHKISLADVQLLARHLIYWRRAIAIPPLNQRDTYIVSPNADFSKIREACKSYESQFPALPSLPKILAFLSGIPAPFGTLIPSPDHKEIYMLVLAWLMRNGLVTQLRTFAYIRVESEVKKLAREWDRDSRASVSQSFGSSFEHSEHKPGSNGNQARPSFLSRRSSEGRQSLKDVSSTKGSTLIKSPPRASPEESRWLAYLHESMREGQGIFARLNEQEREELYQHWPLLSKYFDGNTALESIPIKEGLKRKLAWNLYARLGLTFDSGVENKDGLNESIIVTVRHW